MESTLPMIGVTGATGFVGSALCEAMAVTGLEFVPLIRRMGAHSTPARVVGDIGPHTNWQESLAGLDCVVHCAAHVHQMGSPTGASASLYHSVNTIGTLRLAEAASRSGVKRLIFISSVKVMGEFSAHGQPFKFDGDPAPVDPYGISKWEAEQGLWKIAEATGLEVVVVRPPLVYGPGVGANFRQLMGWVARGIPLPIGAIKNQRSLVSVVNLVDLVLKCVLHPSAPGQTFFVSDGQDLSTPELVSELALAMGRKPRMLNLPVGMLRLLGNVTGRAAQMERLTGNLQVDIEHTQRTLDWAPVCSVRQGMNDAVRDFRSP